MNDVLHENSAEQILTDIIRFKKSVLSMNRDTSSGEMCSFAVATLPFSPLIAVLPSKSRSVQDNKLQILIDLMSGIRKLNKNTVNPITCKPLEEYNTSTFHIWGRRGRGS